MGRGEIHNPALHVRQIKSQIRRLAVKMMDFSDGDGVIVQYTAEVISFDRRIVVPEQVKDPLAFDFPLAMILWLPRTNTLSPPTSAGELPVLFFSRPVSSTSLVKGARPMRQKDSKQKTVVSHFTAVGLRR